MKNIEINRQQPYYRLLEIFPGFITWFVFLIPIFMAFYTPVFLACLIIIYAVYWLLKALIMSVRLITGYKLYKKEVNINWIELCNKRKIPWQNIYHLVIIATYKESFETLRYSLDAIAKANYPKDRLIVVLGTEERAKEIGRENAQKLSKIYAKKFACFKAIEHPANLPNEIAGKGANITYAIKQIKKYIDAEKIEYKNIMVSTFDSDHRPHPQYFAGLTYKYLTVTDPIHKSYQPLPMFFNNIWDVPIPIRSISIGSSFWQIIESTRPYRLRNFAAHAQPLPALIETNYWSTNTIVEDGHQFWRSYFAFDGNHEVVPMNIPVYQDAVLSNKGYINTFIEQYLQKKRWAWGCSDIPYVIINCIKDRKISWQEKILQIYRLVEGHISWSTTSIILFFAGWLPLLINPDFRQTVMAFNFPYIYSRILTFATVGMVVTLSISTLMLPPRPKVKFNYSILLEWILTPFMLPFFNIFFSSIPAVHAQTLLMMGKYMGYHVTDKKAVRYDKYRHN